MTSLLSLDKKSKDAILAELKRLGDGCIPEAVKPIVQEYAMRIKQTAKQRYSSYGIDRTGALGKEIRIGKFVFRKKKGMAWAAAGIGKGVYPRTTGAKRLKGHAMYGLSGGVVKPSKYAHLVERGTARGGWRKKPSRAYPFMRPAWDAHSSPCLEAVIQGIRKAVGL